jgi:hypothetical protein
MNVVNASEFTNRIEEALSLSIKAGEDPDAAQILVDLLKTLQEYHVSTSFSILLCQLLVY